MANENVNDSSIPGEGKTNAEGNISDNEAIASPAYTIQDNLLNEVKEQKEEIKELKNIEQKEEMKELEYIDKKQSVSDDRYKPEPEPEPRQSSNGYWKHALMGGIVIGLVGAAAIGFYIYTNYYSDSALLQQNQEFKFKNESLKTEINGLNNKIEVYKQHNFRDRDGRIEALQELNEKYYKELQSSKSEIAEFKWQNTKKLDTTQKQIANNAQKLKQEIEILRDSATRHQSKYQALEAEYTSLQEQLISATAQDVQLKVTAQTLLATKKKLQKENQELNDKLSSALATNAGLRPTWKGTLLSAFPWLCLFGVVVTEENQRKEAIEFARGALIFSVVMWLLQWIWSHRTRKAN